ncbi:MAG TPA: site-specific integrase [Xanthobacteraceae bacterium]|nr:site-specific integrase [Xanthobacteraceae bacterium]
MHIARGKPVIITIQERRSADGLDAHIPIILRDGALYDADLDRFLLDLPLNGVRSPHSLRAYGYDVVVWVRFLAEACGKTVWLAECADVAVFHRARRRADAGFRISAASWNRSVASLEKLYRWAELEGLVAATPFTHRDAWRRGHGGRRARITARNDAYERAAKRSDVRFISLEDYRAFRDVGLRGLTADGAERPGARDRNGARNALFAELLLTTGLRLEEASFLLASELAALLPLPSRSRQAWLELPPALTKGDRGRRVLLPRRLLQQIAAYVGAERAMAVAKFEARSGWRAIERPIFIRRPTPGALAVALCAGSTILVDALTPEERGRLVICAEGGAPQEPAVLWLTEVGQPIQPNSWEAIFARASRRCADAGIAIRVSPHQLRHSFAVHMLAMLIQHRLRDAAIDPTTPMEGYRRLLGDPLQQVQRLLGHASLTTTYIYLDHIATRADTVDAAIEELLALVPNERSP